MNSKIPNNVKEIIDAIELNKFPEMSLNEKVLACIVDSNCMNDFREAAS